MTRPSTALSVSMLAIATTAAGLMAPQANAIQHHVE